TGIDSIEIVPYDRSYVPQTFAVKVDGPKEYLGKFKMQPRIHKVFIKVNLTGSEGAHYIHQADVAIEGVDAPINKRIVEGEKGFYTEFVNNSTQNFRLRVRPYQETPENEEGTERRVIGEEQSGTQM